MGWTGYVHVGWGDVHQDSTSFDKLRVAAYELHTVLTPAPEVLILGKHLGCEGEVTRASGSEEQRS
jgi:hypothetical protein